MVRIEAELCVYGADRLCASCVNLPSAKDTYEWLQAAIGRKYPNQTVVYHYVNIDQLQENQAFQQMSHRIVEEDLFYPLVTINGEILAEGNAKLKPIYAVLEQLGYSAEK